MGRARQGERGRVGLQGWVLARCGKVGRLAAELGWEKLCGAAGAALCGVK